MVIADSNVWIDYFTGLASPVVRSLTDLIRTRRAAVVGIVITELVRGTRTANEVKILKTGLRGVRYLEMNAQAWERGGSLAGILDASGTPIPLADAIIAGFALEHGHEVLTRDRHFGRVPGIRLYKP